LLEWEEVHQTAGVGHALFHKEKTGVLPEEECAVSSQRGLKKGGGYMSHGREQKKGRGQVFRESAEKRGEARGAGNSPRFGDFSKRHCKGQRVITH